MLCYLFVRIPLQRSQASARNVYCQYRNTVTGSKYCIKCRYNGTRRECRDKAKASRHPSPPNFSIVQPSPAQPSPRRYPKAEYEELPSSSYLRLVSSLPLFPNNDDDTRDLI
jgi:hypothetical protein